MGFRFTVMAVGRIGIEKRLVIIDLPTPDCSATREVWAMAYRKSDYKTMDASCATSKSEWASKPCRNGCMSMNLNHPSTFCVEEMVLVYRGSSIGVACNKNL